jgi:hypothetical protein
MKIRNIEDQKLPQSFRRIVAQLMGRPLYAFLWFIWLWWSAALILKLYLLDARNESTIVKFTYVLCVLSGAYYFLDMILALVRSSGRKWLFSFYHDEQIGSTGSLPRLAVRMAPILTLLLVMFFWFTK